MRLHIDVIGDEELHGELAGLQHRSVDASPALEALADDFLAIGRRQFSSEGGDDHWEPLKASTVRRRGSAHPILVDSGRLRAALTTRGAEGGIRDIDSDELHVGVGGSLYYARFAQRPTGRHEPQRKVIDFTRTDLDRWERGLRDFLVHGPRER